jgi:hypothetical protein
MDILQNSVDYVNFLIKHKLSTNQFLLLHLLNSEKLIKKKSGTVGFAIGTCIYKWQSNGLGWSQNEIEDLIKKEYVVAFKKHYGEGKEKVYGYTVDDLILTNKFADIMFVNTDEAFEDMLSIYPDTFLINNQTVFTKSGDLDKLSEEYGKLIKNSIHEHDKIKEVILFAKERGLCNMKLDKFISKGVIEPIKKMMEDRPIGQSEL